MVNQTATIGSSNRLKSISSLSRRLQGRESGAWPSTIESWTPLPRKPENKISIFLRNPLRTVEPQFPCPGPLKTATMACTISHVQHYSNDNLALHERPPRSRRSPVAGRRFGEQRRNASLVVDCPQICGICPLVAHRHMSASMEARFE